MKPLDAHYNCCPEGQLPDLSEFSALTIFPVLPNSNIDGNTVCQIVTPSELNTLTENQHATLMYTLHARTNDGDLAPLHDDSDLVSLLKISKQLADTSSLPLELEFFFNGTNDGKLPDMTRFQALEVNAVVTRTLEDGSTECEAVPGIVVGTTPIKNVPKTLRDTMLYTLYGREVGSNFAVALHDEKNLDLLLEIAKYLGKKSQLAVIMN